jgi:hypothetical protein
MKKAARLSGAGRRLKCERRDTTACFAIVHTQKNSCQRRDRELRPADHRSVNERGYHRTELVARR